MPKEIKVWKLNWFKNDSDKGGAMNEAISKALDGQVIIHSQTTKIGRMWTSISPDKFINLVLDNKGLYEVITKYPHKVYFDIDKQGQVDVSYLQKVKAIIEKYFPSATFAISGSYKETKTSFHIILTNYLIHNENERTYIKHLCKFLQKEDEAFDWKVYTTNRNMKCINQSKDDGRVQEIIENDDMKAHMITCFLPEYPIAFQLPPVEIEEHIKIEKSRGNFDVASLPKLNLQVPDNLNFAEITPTQILELLPVSKAFDHNYTHLVARFCHANDLPVEMFLAWISKKHSPLTQEIIKKWKHHFNDLHKYPPVSIAKMKNVLTQYYPKINKGIHYNRFEQTFNIGETTKIEMLAPEHFIGAEKFSVYNIGMGGGKTEQTIQFLKDEPSFCWCAPNRALANNTLARLEAADIHVKYYNDISPKEKKADGFSLHEKLIVVANSLHYIKEQKYRVVVIDEIETLLDKWFGPFMTHKAENWKVFCNIIQKAQKVILLDAFITTKTLDFLRAVSAKKYKIFERVVEPTTRNVTYATDFQQCFLSVLNDLKKGLKLFIFYPYKKGGANNPSMEAFNLLLETETGKKGIYYNADIDENIKIGLKDVSKSWSDKDFIITNMMITCGVNYDEKGDNAFDKEYLFVSSFSKPRDVTQVSYRPRTIKTNEIILCYIGSMSQSPAWEMDTEIISCPIYKQLIFNILVELKSPLRKTLQLFFNKAHYKQHTNREALTGAISTEIDEMIAKYQNSVVYRHVDDIDNGLAELIQQRMFSNEATMMEKFQLQKYFFKMTFNADAEFVMLGEVNALDWFWNENKNTYFFKQIERICDDENNIFNKIKKFNNYDSVFPRDAKKVKLNEELKDQIFKDFNFRTINKHSCTISIIVSIYNSYFGKKIITTHYDSNKHITYTLQNAELDFAVSLFVNYRRTPKAIDKAAVSVATCVTCNQMVCVCHSIINHFRNNKCWIGADL